MRRKSKERHTDRKEKMIRVFLEDTQADLQNPTVKAFMEMVYGFAQKTVEYAVEHNLDLNDIEAMWHQAITVPQIEASLKHTFKSMREKKDAIGNP